MGESIKEPAVPDGDVGVVLTSSEEYLPYTCVTVSSLLCHRSANRRYDVTVLHQGLTPEAAERLKGLCLGAENVSIHLMDVRGYMERERFNVSGVPHTSPMTYARLLIPELFRERERIIYLDSDAVVCRDIAALMDTEFPAEAWLAGVQDVDVLGQYYGPGRAGRYYLDRVLGLEQPDRYIQAGVLVMKPERMHRMYPDFQLLKMAGRSRLRYADQDILNCLCNTTVALLDMRWNVVNDCGGYRISRFISRAPETARQEYFAARQKPWIVHYSGFEKPWNAPDTDMGEYFLEHARRLGLVLPAAQGPGAPRGRMAKAAKKWLGAVCPPESKRRDILKLAYMASYYHRH